MKIFAYKSELWLPQNRKDVFAFFADAGNLQTLTPPWLKFEITTPRPIVMRVGALIDYRLTIRGFPVNWQTEIRQWQPPFRFSDRQIKGPYRQWHHEHRFETKDGGTLCTDDVRYAVPGGWLVDLLVVRHDVKRIFNYRRQKLIEIFKPK
jgi:ligand-binding SRPBCC domain-containing protein